MQLFHLRFNIPHPATHVPPIGSKTITHCNICKNETVSEIHADHNMGVDILENVDIPSVHIFFFCKFVEEFARNSFRNASTNFPWDFFSSFSIKYQKVVLETTPRVSEGFFSPYTLKNSFRDF